MPKDRLEILKVLEDIKIPEGWKFKELRSNFSFNSGEGFLLLSGKVATIKLGKSPLDFKWQYDDGTDIVNYTEQYKKIEGNFVILERTGNISEELDSITSVEQTTDQVKEVMKQ
ncbi:hypothetical protein K9M41_03960 [Candidatus Gracilibacteria bacterium]|nr:hypothetical protein [Candidatus Gracilibacteria bacterium]